MTIELGINIHGLLEVYFVVGFWISAIYDKKFSRHGWKSFIINWLLWPKIVFKT